MKLNHQATSRRQTHRLKKDSRRNHFDIFRTEKQIARIIAVGKAVSLTVKD